MLSSAVHNRYDYLCSYDRHDEQMLKIEDDLELYLNNMSAKEWIEESKIYAQAIIANPHIWNDSYLSCYDKRLPAMLEALRQDWDRKGKNYERLRDALLAETKLRTEDDMRDYLESGGNLYAN